MAPGGAGAGSEHATPAGPGTVPEPASPIGEQATKPEKDLQQCLPVTTPESSAPAQSLQGEDEARQISPSSLQQATEAASMGERFPSRSCEPVEILSYAAEVTDAESAGDDPAHQVEQALENPVPDGADATAMVATAESAADLESLHLEGRDAATAGGAAGASLQNGEPQANAALVSDPSDEWSPASVDGVSSA